MNEASLEGRLNTTLDRIFSGPIRPKIEHQRTLVLKLGHHNVEVDGIPKAEARGRLDVLLLLEGKNLAVLELKSPELELTDDDEAQAWSYARLLHPMPPFYIVTNGTETRMFRTYDRSRVDGATLDERAIAEQISAAAGAAAADQQTAIHYLLGKSPEAFQAVFRRISLKQLRFVMGSVAEVTRPVCKEFGIVRDAVFALYHVLANERSAVVTLFGEALAGKTNVAADLIHFSYSGAVPSTIAPVYVNCDYLEHGFLQTLADEVSAETHVSASADDVRHWLRSRILSSAGARPVIIVDSWSPDAAERLGAELSELLDLAGPETFAVVVVVDSAHSDQVLSTTRRGQPSKLAALTITIPVLATMSDREVMTAAQLLYQRKRLTLEAGALHNPLYRLPSTWRMLAAYDGQVQGGLPAALGAEQLHNILAHQDLSAEQADDLRAYCAAVLDDRTSRLQGVLLASPGAVGLRYAKDALGEQRLERLIRWGFVRVRTTHAGRSIVTAQIPQLLAATSVAVIQDRLEEALEEWTVDAAVDAFLASCRRLPYCELVGAAAYFEEGLSEETRTAVINRLLEMEPTITELPADARLAVLIEGREPVELAAELTRSSVDERGAFAYGRILPYVIVSHVMRWCAVKDGRVSEPMLGAIRRVASARLPLISMDLSRQERLRHAAPLASLDLRGGGTVLAACNGVIEPITDVLRLVALDATEDFAALIGTLLSEERPSFPLLHRTWMATSDIAQLRTPIAARAHFWTEALERLINARCSEELVTTEEPDGER